MSWEVTGQAFLTKKLQQAIKGVKILSGTIHMSYIMQCLLFGTNNWLELNLFFHYQEHCLGIKKLGPLRQKTKMINYNSLPFGTTGNVKPITYTPRSEKQETNQLFAKLLQFSESLNLITCIRAPSWCRRHRIRHNRTPCN